MLVSMDEIKKEELAFAGEKTQASFIAPSQSIEVQPTMSSHISMKVQNDSIPTITIIEKE